MRWPAKPDPEFRIDTHRVRLNKFLWLPKKLRLMGTDREEWRWLELANIGERLAGSIHGDWWLYEVWIDDGHDMVKWLDGTPRHPQRKPAEIRTNTHIYYDTALIG